MKEVIALVAPPWWLIPSKNLLTATEHLVEEYAYNLSKCGYKNVIFAREKDDTDSYEKEDVNGFNNDYRYIPLGKMDRKYLAKMIGKSYRGSLFFYWIYILRVSFKIRKMKISQVVVFQTFTFCFWLKIINPKLKLIYHIGNHELSKKSKYFNYEIISNETARKVLPKIDYLIAVSDYLKQGIIERFPELSNRCVVVYPGIDLNIFKSKWENGSSREKIIMYAGRVVPEKGIHVLVEAFKMLKRDIPDIKLQIYGMDIGPNVQENYLSQLKDDAVELLGLYPRKEIAEVLRKAAIFVYPVIWEEALGLAPLEAMTVGVPVIVSDVKSGYSEFINNHNGFYFNTGDSVQLKDIMKKILEEPERQHDIGCNARETIKTRLSWRQCVEKTVQYLEEDKYE